MSLSEGAGPDELDSFLAAGFVQEEFPNRLSPNGATRDLTATKEARARGQALLSAESFEIANAVASGEYVAMELKWQATIREVTGPFTAGQVISAKFAVFLEFHQGRILRQRNYDCFDPWS